MTKSSSWLALSLCIIGFAGCAKKTQSPPDYAAAPSSSASAAASTASTAAPVADQSAEQAERAHKVALLDYATMEDTYINDPRAQWASTAKASSEFGQHDGSVNDVSKAKNIVGPVDGSTWTNDSQNIGFDWVEASFAKPVHATEIRVVFTGGQGVEAVNKLEVQDIDGHWSTVWSGLSDMQNDERGQRTWFVRTFDKTAAPIKTVKMTIANNVQSGYKVVDAIQLVGD